MANENMIQFLRGNVANLPQTATPGALYFTKDEGVYLGLENGSYHRYGDFITVADVNSLPATGAHATCMYYCTSENILARYDSVKGWVQINKQPTAEELKTLLGLGDLAYLSEVTEDDLGTALKEKVDNKVDKETGKSLVADTEITKLAGVSEGANKVEASTNGKIKIDGVDTTVYTHPDKHAIADVDGLQDALDGLQAKGDYAAEEHTHTKDDITDFAHTHTKDEITDFDHTHTADDITDLDDTIKGYDYATNTYVGAIPETAEATNIVAYIQEKTAGIATDTALEELTGRVATAENNIAAINNEETGILAQAKTYVDEEDVFETDMATINALGGIAAGADLNGLTTHEVLKKLLYPYVDATVGNATATPNGGTYEKGATKTITQVSISITKKSEPITSVALYNGSTLIEEKTGDAVKNGGTITFTNLSVEVPTNGNQLTVKVTYPDANGNAKTVEKKTTALTFVYPYYMGTCAAGTAIDETLVESLTKKIEGKGNKSNSFTVSDGHMVFAYPKAHGVLKSILDPNNFETIGNYTRSEVSVTGLDGTAQTYYVYVSGATTVSGFVVNFKY